LFAHLYVAGTKLTFPNNVALFSIYAPQRKIVAVGDIKKDKIAPNNWR
jgi:hypothetical protein